jgi:hemerythrin-like domain-containing protein
MPSSAIVAHFFGRRVTAVTDAAPRGGEAVIGEHHPMAHNHPVDILMSEHQTILGVLDVFEARARELGSTPFPDEFFAQALDFFRNFADGCHHAKEEELLFPLLERRGIPREHGPIGCMLKEHNQGREYLGLIRGNLIGARADSFTAIATIRAAALDYAEMLRQHIYKEDNILFQMAIRALSAEDAAQLVAEFQSSENPRLAPETRAHYEELARTLTASAAVA